MGLTEFSPAKINLNLHVLGRRPDGYHEIFSLVGFASYGDELSFEAGGMQDRLVINGSFAADIDGENIILKAARLLREQNPGIPFGLFTLNKNLPVASGMGGGSSNAAAALRLLSPYTSSGYGLGRLSELALELGADVPVCLMGEAVYMSGIGEKIEPAFGIAPQYALLVNPLVKVSTAQVFEKLQARRITGNPVVSEGWYCRPSQHKDFQSYLLQTENDLEQPAQQLEPQITVALEMLKTQEGCFLSRMSGSGATCFGLFDSKENALVAAKVIKGKKGDWWVVNADIS